MMDDVPLKRIKSEAKFIPEHRIICQKNKCQDHVTVLERVKMIDYNTSVYRVGEDKDD